MVPSEFGETTNLLYGDTILLNCLENPGYLIGPVVGNEGIFVESLVYSELPPSDLHACKFQILNKQQCVAQKTFAKELASRGLKEDNWVAELQSKLNDMGFGRNSAAAARLKVSEKAAMLEKQVNKSELMRSMGTHVRYGHMVQLRHEASKRFVVLRKENARLETQNIFVALTDVLDEACWFTLRAGYKTQSEGSAVMYGEPLTFTSASFPGSHLHCAKISLSDTVMEDRTYHPYVQEMREVNASREISTFKAFPFKSIIDKSGEEGLLCGGDVVIVSHPSSSTILHVDDGLAKFHPQREPTHLGNMASTMKTLSVLAVSTDMWVIEMDGKDCAGSRVHAGKPFRLRHLTTGLYLKTSDELKPSGKHGIKRGTIISTPSATNVTHLYNEPATLWSISNDHPGSVVEGNSLVYCVNSSNPGAAVMLTCNSASLNGDTKDDGMVTFSKVHRLDNMLAFHRVDPQWANQVYRFMHIYQEMQAAARQLQKGVRRAVFRGQHKSPNRCRVGNWSVAHNLNMRPAKLRWDLAVGNIVAGVKAGHYTSMMSPGVGLSIRTAMKAASCGLTTIFQQIYTNVECCISNIIQDCVRIPSSKDLLSKELLDMEVDASLQQLACEQGILGAALDFNIVLFDEKYIPPQEIFKLPESMLGGDLRRLCMMIQRVVTLLCLHNLPNKMFLLEQRKGYMGFLHRFLAADFGVMETLRELYVENPQYLFKVAVMELGLVTEFALKLKETQFLKFMSALCKHNQLPIPLNQNRIMSLLFDKAAGHSMASFLQAKVVKDRHTGSETIILSGWVWADMVEVDVSSIDSNSLDDVHSLTRTHSLSLTARASQYARVMTLCCQVADEGAALESEQDVTREERAVILHMDIMALLTTLLYGRNRQVADETLRNCDMLAFGYNDLMGTCFNTRLPAAVRAHSIQLMQALYVDQDPYLSSDAVMLTHCWAAADPTLGPSRQVSEGILSQRATFVSLASHVYSQFPEASPEVIDPGFRRLRAHLVVYLKSLKGRINIYEEGTNMLIATVVKLIFLMIKQGIFRFRQEDDRSEQIGSLMSSLVSLLDGRSDILIDDMSKRMHDKHEREQAKSDKEQFNAAAQRHTARKARKFARMSNILKLDDQEVIMNPHVERWHKALKSQGGKYHDLTNRLRLTSMHKQMNSKARYTVDKADVMKLKSVIADVVEYAINMRLNKRIAHCFEQFQEIWWERREAINVPLPSPLTSPLSHDHQSCVKVDLGPSGGESRACSNNNATLPHTPDIIEDEARPFDASELEPEDWEDERAGVPPSAQQELLKPFEHSVIEQLAHDLLNVDIYTQSSDDDGTNDVTATQLLEVLLDTVQYHKLDIKAKGFMLLDRQLSQRSVMIRHMLKAQVLVYPEVISAYKHFRSAMAVVPQLFGRIISTTDSDSASRSQAFSTCSEIFSHIALMCTPGAPLLCAPSAGLAPLFILALWLGRCPAPLPALSRPVRRD
ncbi:hypothetical protein CYMTET_39992 [Cymbomonas tetramitiformis]|uniref:MIR domain-containing protein n=1 Tax=Cymbomonas tetramitiformis TaxID=36881 RepID=A0AAE0CB19_9CHLO|nr:hypothetical protein CYMTET_39992 [Cymbomonas tetramitiformis]